MVPSPAILAAHTILNAKDHSPRSQQIFSWLKVTRLRKVAGLRSCPTNDLHGHLRLDHRAGTVNIYHHTAVLKEHLMCSRSSAKNGKLIPRQLALEVIDSIQKVLFPSDLQSQSLLRSLVRNRVSTTTFCDTNLRPTAYPGRVKQHTLISERA